VAGSCEYGSEPSGFIILGNFDQLNYYQPLKKTLLHAVGWLRHTWYVRAEEVVSPAVLHNFSKVCTGTQKLTFLRNIVLGLEGKSQNKTLSHITVPIVTMVTVEDIRQISSFLTLRHDDKCQAYKQGLRINNNTRGNEA
jgi:hypothetical protein